MVFTPSSRTRAGLLDVLRKFPTISAPLIVFHETLLRGPSPFTEAERELIGAYVAELNNCHRSSRLHAVVAERLGMPRGAIRDLLTSGRTTRLPAPLKPVMVYVRKLTSAVGGVGPADAEEIFAAGWNRTALHHLVTTTALFNFMSRFEAGLGVAPDPAYIRPMARRLAKYGYLPLLRLLDWWGTEDCTRPGQLH